MKSKYSSCWQRLPPGSSTCPPVTAFWAGSSSLLRDPWILKIAALFRAFLDAERNFSILVLNASGMTRLLIPTNNIFLQPTTTLYHIDNGRNILTRPDLWLAENIYIWCLIKQLFNFISYLGFLLERLLQNGNFCGGRANKNIFLQPTAILYSYIYTGRCLMKQLFLIIFHILGSCLKGYSTMWNFLDEGFSFHLKFSRRFYIYISLMCCLEFPWHDHFSWTWGEGRATIKQKILHEMDRNMYFASN